MRAFQLREPITATEKNGGKEVVLIKATVNGKMVQPKGQTKFEPIDQFHLSPRDRTKLQIQAMSA